MFFYSGRLLEGAKEMLPEDTAKHIGQVLRMMTGAAIRLTDGLGMMADCRLNSVAKRRVEVTVGRVSALPQQAPALRLAIAFTKNAARNEWLLEKATELGVQRITPLITERSVRERARTERWTAILISAMLQSKQSWLPVLDAPVTVSGLLNAQQGGQLMIAHCMDAADAVPWASRSALPQAAQPGSARAPLLQALQKGQNAVIMIGPEGDFTPAEVSLAEAAGAVAISLGPNRLRTETAALAAITHFYLLNHASPD